MQAVVLAGGKGTRLRPLTSNTPKPMVKLFGKPVLEHTINLLKRHDVHDVIITVAYQADKIIEYFGNGSKWDMRIQYSLENQPKGTAGALRLIQPVIHDTFLVISGDAVTDLDLSSALAFHKRSSAIATLLTYQVDDPSQFGVVDSHNDGRIARFQEKPKASEAFCNTVNTGIYIMEPEIISYVPHDSVYDFSKNVFPALLNNREPFYSFNADGYWCDMGSLSQYRNVHFDALTGKVNLDLSANCIGDGIYVGDHVDIHPTAKMLGPVYIGSGTHIGRKSTLGRFAVVGNKSLINDGAHVTHSVIHSGSKVGRNAEVYGSIVGAGYDLREGLQLSDEVIVRDEANAALRAEIADGSMSYQYGEQPFMTWSALEASRAVAQFPVRQAIAA